MPDWFRRTSWTREDEHQFFERLARSRGNYNKSQYLRIQASHLEDTGDRANVESALRLLDQLLREFPEPSQVACALWQRARCKELLGDISAAIESFRKALDAERQFPNARTGATLDLAWLIATRELRDLYDEALALVDSHRPSIAFPVDSFRAASIRALIALDRGDKPTASRLAAIALESADRKHSGLRYHKTVGLVGSSYENVVEKMRRWVNGREDG